MAAYHVTMLAAEIIGGEKTTHEINIYVYASNPQNAISYVEKKAEKDGLTVIEESQDAQKLN